MLNPDSFTGGSGRGIFLGDILLYLLFSPSQDGTYEMVSIAYNRLQFLNTFRCRNNKKCEIGS